METYVDEDTDLAEALRDEIIPHAVRFFTGEITDAPAEELVEEFEAGALARGVKTHWMIAAPRSVISNVVLMQFSGVTAASAKMHREMKTVTPEEAAAVCMEKVSNLERVRGNGRVF